MIRVAKCGFCIYIGVLGLLTLYTYCCSHITINGRQAHNILCIAESDTSPYKSRSQQCILAYKHVRLTQSDYYQIFGRSYVRQHTPANLRIAAMALALFLICAIPRTSSLPQPIFGYGFFLLTIIPLGAVTIYGLNHDAMWGDTLSTAVYGKNLVETGKITAWDGNNLLAYTQGGSLKPDLSREYRAPVLPIYIAATGFCMYGYNDFGARILFVIIGLASIIPVMYFSRRWFDRVVPCWLVGCVMVMSTAYWLYIGDCRYYAPSIFLTAVASCAFIYLPGRRNFIFTLLAVTALFFTNLFAAVATYLVLLFFVAVDRRWRTRSHVWCLVAITAVVGMCGLWFYFYDNPYLSNYSMVGKWLFGDGKDALPVRDFDHFLKFFSDLNTNEYLPLLLLPVLAIPFVKKRETESRIVCFRVLPLLGCIIIHIAVAAAAATPDTGGSDVAEIRYIVAVLAFTNVIIAACLYIVFKHSRVVVSLLVVTLLLSGALYGRVRGSIFRYVDECVVNQTTGNEYLIAYLRTIPASRYVKIYPEFYAFSAIFYCPQLQLVDMLDPAKRITDEMRSQLPTRVYTGKVEPDIVIVPVRVYYKARQLLSSQFRVVATLSGSYRFVTRPELSLHVFPTERISDGSCPSFVIFAKGQAEE